MIGSHLEIYTFDNLMKMALDTVPDGLDKGQGSVIYDALAPACYRLAEVIMNIRNAYTDTYAITAEGEALDNRVAEQGVTRYPATYALKKATFVDSLGNPALISLGSRLSTISDIAPVTYFVESQYFEGGAPVAGAYNLRCETAGTVGNEYTGELMTITHIKGLASATMSDLITPARDTETDDDLRDRYFDTINNKAYGGNIAQYNQDVKAISGVGEVQIYPVWNGGGTVKLSIVDAEYNPCSSDFLIDLKNRIDPEPYSGMGVGTAPIGHNVTVVTPTELTINVSMTISIAADYSITQVTPLIKDAISEYFKSVRKDWGQETSLGNYSSAIYIARVVMSALQVKGVDNVTNVTLNGSASDLILTQNSQLQQLPKLGEVTINA